MKTVIITAQVDDADAWAKNFRTHETVFKQYTATRVRYGTADDYVATLWDVEDADAMLESIQQPDTIEAMTADGVNRDSVRVFVLDEKIDL